MFGFVPARQGWKFCIFGQPGCEPKKSLGAKDPRRKEREEKEREKKKEEKGSERKREGRGRKRGVQNGRDQKKYKSPTKPGSYLVLLPLFQSMSI